MRVLRFRICHVPVGDVIENCVSVFRDKQDEGITILTPIYLLAGCSVPVWLNLVNPNAEIGDMNEVETAAAFSGVLSIAVGDTFASIGGSIFGRHKWKGEFLIYNNAKHQMLICAGNLVVAGSNKTVEGTGFSIAAQFIFIFLMWYYGETKLRSPEFSSERNILTHSVFRLRRLQLDNTDKSCGSCCDKCLGGGSDRSNR